MSSQIITEFLAAHADQMNRGEQVQKESLLGSLPEGANEAGPLMDVATRLKQALAPAATPAKFRAQLRDGLSMAARHRESQRILIARPESPWGWILGAAAVGSAAGLIAIAMRVRSSRQPAQSMARESSPSN